MAAGEGTAPWPAPPPIRRIYVVAGNHREFLFWMRDNGMKRSDPRVRYISDFSLLMGCIIEESKGDRVVLYGTYESRYDWPLIVEELKPRWRD